MADSQSPHPGLASPRALCLMEGRADSGKPQTEQWISVHAIKGPPAQTHGKQWKTHTTGIEELALLWYPYPALGSKSVIQEQTPERASAARGGDHRFACP